MADNTTPAAWNLDESRCRVFCGLGAIPTVGLTFVAPANDPAITRLAEGMSESVLMEPLLDALRTCPQVQRLRSLETEYEAALEEEKRVRRELFDTQTRRREAVANPGAGGLGKTLAALDEDIARLEAEHAKAGKAVAAVAPHLAAARREALVEAGSLRRRLGAAATPALQKRNQEALAKIKGRLNALLTELAASARAAFSMAMGTEWGGQEAALLESAGVKGYQPTPPPQQPAAGTIGGDRHAAALA